MVNRDRHDLIIEVLGKAASGKHKTELMNTVGLCSRQAKQYLGILLDKGLLKVDDEHCFRITKQGKLFLEMCEMCPLTDRSRMKL